MKVRYVLLLLAILVAPAIAGCTSSAPGPDNQNISVKDRYASAYYSGIKHFIAGESHFNNGTSAWEKEDYRQAINDYADASAEYGSAASNYEAMSGYASGELEKDFSLALLKCSNSLSMAASDFMESSIRLQMGEIDKAYQMFVEGRGAVKAGEAYLNQSAYLVPGWLQDTGNNGI